MRFGIRLYNTSDKCKICISNNDVCTIHYFGWEREIDRLHIQLCRIYNINPLFIISVCATCREEVVERALETVESYQMESVL